MATNLNSGPKFEKNCIIVKRLGKFHVRRYASEVTNGMDSFKATHDCIYRNMTQLVEYLTDNEAWYLSDPKKELNNACNECN